MATVANYLTNQAARQAAMVSKFERHFLGFLVNLASLLVIEALIVWAGWSISLAIPFGVLSFTVYRWSGFRGALFSAILITSFSVYHWDRYGWNGFIQIAIGAFGIAGFGGITKRALIRTAVEAERNRHAIELINAANGNLGKLREIHIDSVKLIDAWKSLSDTAKYEVVNNIRGNLAHVLNIWEGWHALFQERETMKWENLRQKLGSKDGD